MKYALPVVVAVAFAFVLVGPLAAQGDAKDIDSKLAEIDKKLEELNQLKDDLTALRDGMEAAPAGEKKGGWEDKVKVNGYYQVRGQYRDYDEDDFDLRRMYINLIITPNDKTMGVVTWARIGPDPFGLTNTDWANVFVDYKWDDEWTTRIGQGPDWFGLETGQSSSQRLAMERASVLEGGRGKPAGMYFAGPWDRGIWVIRNPQHGEWDPQVIVGLINGQFRSSEKDNNKTVTVDLKWKQKWGEFGVSWLDGKYVWDITTLAAPAPFTGTTFDREAIVGYVRWDPEDCRWAVQGEYLDGDHLGADIEGWYTQLEYATNKKGTAFVKYERHDAAVGMPGPLGATDYRAWHFGYSHWLDANNELTLQLTDGDNTGMSRQELVFQWQLGF